ncbi:MAG TPA: anti-sigma regulatory factor [Allocoleopsis sp.]
MKTELSVPSDLKFLNIVESWMLGCLEVELGSSADWPKQSNKLRLVLVEAYANVVRHAHKDQPHLPVVIGLELENADLALEIWDHGRGYQLDNYQSPLPEDLNIHGYGWAIIQKLMDKVEYQLQIDGRNCLKLEVSLGTK